MGGEPIDTTARETTTTAAADDGGWDDIPGQPCHCGEPSAPHTLSDHPSAASVLLGGRQRGDAPPPADEPPTDRLPVPAGIAAEPHPPLTGELETLPPRNELEMLAQLAATFAGAALVPDALQGRPADCLLVLMTARDLGLSITTAFRELHPIDGRVTASPKIKLAIVRQRGLGRVWPDPANDATSATWYATRADDPTGVVYSSTFTMADAKMAQLDNKKNWKTYPARMLSWRAMGYLLDDTFTEVGTGLYSADELGAITDADGQVIDVASAEPLQGMVTEQQKRKAERQAQADAPADPDDLWQLQARIHALPELQRLAWLEQKHSQPRLRGRPSHLLAPKDMKLARSIVGGLESAAAKGGLDVDAAIAAVKLRAATAVVSFLAGAAPVDAPDGLPAEPEYDVDPEPATAPQSPQDDLGAPTPPADAPQRSLAQPAALTGGDASQLMGDIGEQVAELSVEQVATELAAAGLSTDGTVKQQRARLVQHEIAQVLARTQTNTTQET